jgi:thiol-disulfide isomerase/thioredoxin
MHAIARSWAQAFVAAACFLVAGVGCTPDAGAVTPQQAPEFAGTGQWFNSAPRTMADLRGKVVLVEFWTYTCINCLHVMPQVKQWHARYAKDGLVVVGVHTPEFDEEHVAANVQNAIATYGIRYPVVQDNDYKTWDAWGNRFWPALYLVDRSGKVVYRHYGEGGYAQTEARIQALLGTH